MKMYKNIKEVKEQLEKENKKICRKYIKQAKQQEQKRIIEIIEKRLSEFPIEENYNCVRREKYRVLLWLKQQIQEDKKQ